MTTPTSYQDSQSTAKEVCGSSDGCHRVASAYRVVINDEVRRLCSHHAAFIDTTEKRIAGKPMDKAAAIFPPDAPESMDFVNGREAWESGWSAAHEALIEAGLLVVTKQDHLEVSASRLADVLFDMFAGQWPDRKEALLDAVEIVHRLNADPH